MRARRAAGFENFALGKLAKALFLSSVGFASAVHVLRVKGFSVAEAFFFSRRLFSHHIFGFSLTFVSDPFSAVRFFFFFWAGLRNISLHSSPPTRRIYISWEIFHSCYRRIFIVFFFLPR